MKRMMLIGLAGYARSGKDSTATILGERGFEKYAFADTLRQMARGIDPYISLAGAMPAIQARFFEQRRHLVVLRPFARYSEIIDTLGYEDAKSIPDFRRFLQRVGTDGVRSVFGDNAWVDALDRVIAELPMYTSACITDVRFPNEAEYIHSRGGYVWRLTRPGFGGNDPHPSEANIPHLPADVDIVADNLDDLRVCVLQGLAEMQALEVA